ncbi:peptide chain release factor-like protein [Rhizobium sp. 2MFCol3.1]|uniref:peptide chain release factor-like protein n=1 Tax=Rhizobium sp. 2MFCol3.1 TaxID=1246459 RepID=UPI0003810D4B|nr:peptide chain release factor-like protein [Rhizobium sp. 2MFCol3.1]
MTIVPDDIKIEVWPIPGIHHRGGQHVGTNPGVRVTHIPSGIAAYVETDRSQRINREIAMDMILAAITHPKFR